jgi:STE24 endopeptidase
VFPSLWPLPAAAGVALAVLVIGFVAPVVIEPLFNHFAPLGDEELATDLRRLADRADTPVREVLVADASRRTRKVNAYVSGLGRTRRVVLFDTLLQQAPARETRLVVAHELGHRKARHMLLGTVIGIAAAVVAVIALWALTRWEALLGAIGATGPGDPAVIPFVLLAVAGFELATMPAGAALGRRWERQADTFSLELTNDPEAFEGVHRRLALANRSDLDPPPLAYVLLFTHPTQPERIAHGRRWAELAAARGDRLSRP